MSNYSKEKTINGIVRYYEEIPMPLSDVVVKHRWSSTAMSLDSFINNAPNVTGYDLIATVNGGGFVTDSSGQRKPHGSLQHFHTSGRWEEIGDEENLCYGDAPEDISIKSGHIEKLWINGVLSPSGVYELIRSSFGFDIYNQNGVLTVRTTSGGTNDRITDEYNYRTGFAFKNNVPYLIVFTSQVSADILRQILVADNFDAYVNMDGGRSTALNIAGEEVIAPGYGYIHEVFYVYKKSPNTMRTKLILPSMSNGHYPTRSTYNGAYNPNGYYLDPNDSIEIIDMKIDGSDIVCQIGNVYKSNGTTSTALSGRWFCYDKNNFD